MTKAIATAAIDTANPVPITNTDAFVPSLEKRLFR
jgi:hypothetical protein